MMASEYCGTVLYFLNTKVRKSLMDRKLCIFDSKPGHGTTLKDWARFHIIRVFRLYQTAVGCHLSHVVDTPTIDQILDYMASSGGAMMGQSLTLILYFRHVHAHF